VIQQLLAGIQRDKIAIDNGLSAGAVTNTVNEWRSALGFYAADALRELGVTLKWIGITPAQSAIGFTVEMMLNRLGVKEENLILYVRRLQSLLQHPGISIRTHCILHYKPP
jgi:hypothetical protein